MSEQWVSPVHAHTTSPTADYERWGEIFRERGWLDPAAAEQLRAERDALLDLHDAAQALTITYRGRRRTNVQWQDAVMAAVRLVIDAVDDLTLAEPTEGAQP